MEGIFITVSTSAWLAPPEKTGFILSWIFLAYLALVTVIDLEHHLILHPVSLAGVLISIPVGTLAHGWLATIFGGMAGFACMFAFYLFGKVFVRVIRRWNPAVDDEALGFGDVSLGAITGFALGGNIGRSADRNPDCGWCGADVRRGVTAATGLSSSGGFPVRTDPGRGDRLPDVFLIRVELQAADSFLPNQVLHSLFSHITRVGAAIKIDE